MVLLGVCSCNSSCISLWKVGWGSVVHIKLKLSINALEELMLVFPMTSYCGTLNKGSNQYKLI